MTRTNQYNNTRESPTPRYTSHTHNTLFKQNKQNTRHTTHENYHKRTQNKQYTGQQHDNTEHTIVKTKHTLTSLLLANFEDVWLNEYIHALPMC